MAVLVPASMLTRVSLSAPTLYRQEVSPTVLQTQKLGNLRRLREHSTLDEKVYLTDSTSDNANFINFCAGKQLTNGQQIAGGSCNGIGEPF